MITNRCCSDLKSFNKGKFEIGNSSVKKVYVAIPLAIKRWLQGAICNFFIVFVSRYHELVHL